MDTGTHLVVGLGLAGLATIDPAVSADPAVAAAVLIGTVVGSQAPDSDSLLRLRGNAAYVRNHRGISHSLPAILLWTASITGLLHVLFGGLPVLTVGLWVFIAVALHVFSDMFNTYGTQALRPFTEKWVSWNIIHIFDPFIFGTHVLAIAAWVSGMAAPQVIFPSLYILTAMYYVWRTIVHYTLERSVYKQDPDHADGDRYYLIPTVQWHVWHLVKRNQAGVFTIGDMRRGNVRWLDRAASAEHPAVEASKMHPNVEAFLYYSSFACAELREQSWGYEVRWADVRYRHRKQYPFVAVVLLNSQFESIDSYVGWLSESKIEKKLRVETY